MKSIMSKFTLKQILFTIYIGFLVCGYFFVNASLKEESKIQLSTKEKELGQNIKEFNVDVVIKGKDTMRFREKVFNNDTILDLLEQLRKDEKITFERVSYTYGIEIEHINKDYASDKKSWNVYMTLDGKNVADNIKNLRLNSTDGDILKDAVGKKTDVTKNISDITLVENGLYEFELTNNN